MGQKLEALKTMNRIHKLDGLRGLFALFVVLFHFNKHNAPQFIVNNFFVRESYMFVDFFFILSGFVITLSYDQKITESNSFFLFLKKRWIRLYPLLLLSTIIYWYFVHPQWNQRTILLALDTFLLTNSTPLLSSNLGMNYPSWSISSEMISYLFFGICAFVVSPNRKPFYMAFITIGCFIVLAFQESYFQTGDFGFARGLACFNLGYFVYLYASKNKHKTLPSFLEWLVLLGIVGLLYFYHTRASSIQGVYLQIFQFLFPIAFAFSILVFVQTNGSWSKLFQTKPFLFLGKISFSVYLNHAFVIGFAIPKLFKWIQLKDIELKKTICIGLLLLLLVIYSWITQYFIEQKLGKRLTTLLKG
jgi:peptidoglycan/LPS O-acetylase OafA/YrhL